MDDAASIRFRIATEEYTFASTTNNAVRARRSKVSFIIHVSIPPRRLRPRDHHPSFLPSSAPTRAPPVGLRRRLDHPPSVLRLSSPLGRRRTHRSEETLRLLAEDLARGDDVREGPPRGDVHDREASRVARLHARTLRLDHRVRVRATVVFVHGGREAEAAGEEARRGVDADDLIERGVTREMERMARASAGRSGGRGEARGARSGGRAPRAFGLFSIGRRGGKKKDDENPPRRVDDGDAGVCARARTAFSGEPMDQSALTRTSRLTAAACASDGTRAGGQFPREARGVVGTAIKRRERAKSLARSFRTMPRLAGKPRPARTFLTEKDFFAPANCGATTGEAQRAFIVTCVSALGVEGVRV